MALWKRINRGETALAQTCVIGRGRKRLSELPERWIAIYSVSNSFQGFRSVAIDSQGNCYVVGTGLITPTVGARQTTPRTNQPQFVVKFNGFGGGIVYATYLQRKRHQTPLVRDCSGR